MNIPDHISRSLETISSVEILKFFDADAAGFGIRDGKIRTLDTHPGFATLYASSNL
jgi:hypothetical protein